MRLFVRWNERRTSVRAKQSHHRRLKVPVGEANLRLIQ